MFRIVIVHLNHEVSCRRIFTNGITGFVGEFSHLNEILVFARSLAQGRSDIVTTDCPGCNDIGRAQFQCVHYFIANSVRKVTIFETNSRITLIGGEVVDKITVARLNDGLVLERYKKLFV